MAKRSVMPLVTSLPSSNSNRGFCYARAEYRNARSERRVLVWQVHFASRGRSGTTSLRENLGAEDLAGTRRSGSANELLAWLVGLESTGRVSMAGEDIVFPEELLVAFVERCRARLADARAGRTSRTGALEAPAPGP